MIKVPLKCYSCGPVCSSVCWSECQITAGDFSDLSDYVALFCLSLFLLVTSLFFFLHVPFSFLSLRINKASDFKDHKIQIASCLISLKVEPLPALSINLSGAPLIKIVLTHVLVRITHAVSRRLLLWPMFLSVMFSVRVSHVGKIGRLFLSAVGCGTPTLSEERGPSFVCCYSSRIPSLWNPSALFLALSYARWPSIPDQGPCRWVLTSLFWF